MLTLVAALALAPQAAYTPTGPVIEVRIAGRGAFHIRTDPKRSPKTVAHISALVKKRFYDKQRIHRVESWVTQWGAPASKDKPLTTDAVLSGGSGKQIPFELADVDFTRGVVGIASTGLQVGGDSQIFVLKADTLRLYSSYAVLGKVTKGMEVVDRIQKGDRIVSMTIKSKP
ncbi:MAG: peptidylprolyl isomerase [Armatimonadota bacterium]|nr:peptidylprolyl isomerase [Armatimonadota bacterium]